MSKRKKTPTNPTIRIDWDAGEAQFVIGSRLARRSWVFRADVLKYLAEQTRATYE